MSLIRVTLRPGLCVLGRCHRVHHGAAGLIVVAAVRRRSLTALLFGALLVLDDRRDWRQWLPDLLRWEP